MNLYHYTTTDAAARILDAGCLRPRPTPLYRDLFGQDLIRMTPPVVWLTENPISESTSWASIYAAAGWSISDASAGVGRIVRIATPELPMMLPWEDWARDTSPGGGGPLADWERNFNAADMAGGDPMIWWVTRVDVPVDANRIEVLSACDRQGTQWDAYQKPL